LKDHLEDIYNKLDDLMKLKAKVAKLAKALKALKKFIMNALGHISQHQSPTRDGEDDAMFTKRPYLGNSCASCDKDIFNLMGTKADFSAW
jgi:hypothetical protein